MLTSRRFLLVVLMCLALVLPATGTPAPPMYLRVTKDGKGKPRTLQTAVSHFVLPSGQRVDLVGAVHMAEGPYYKALNQRFKQYDAVLYELIVSGDGRPDGPIEIPKDDGGGSMLSQVQMSLCRMLGLQFQLHSVDYSARNFRHADLTLNEFNKMMAQRGETSTDLLMKIIQIAMTNSGSVDERELEQLDLLGIITRGPTPAEQKALRRVFATSFPEIERLTAEIQGTTLIAGRNQRAIEVLAKELKGGRRTFAIFYGAGHMIDMEKRVLKIPGARLEGREWLDAWHLEGS